MNITIEDCEIEGINNSADGLGGIAYILEASTFTIKDSNISKLSQKGTFVSGALVYSTVSSSIEIILESNTVSCYDESNYYFNKI